MKSQFIFLFFFFIVNNIQNQQRNRQLSIINSLLIYIKQNQLKKADSVLYISNLPKEIKKNLQWQIDFKSKGLTNEIEFSNNKIPKHLKSKFESLKRITLGEYYANKLLDNNKAFKMFFEAKEIAKKNNDSILVCIALKKILRFNLQKAEKIELIYNELEDLKKFAYDDYEKFYHQYLSLRYKHLVYSEKQRLKFLERDSSYFNIRDSLNILPKLKILETKITNNKFSFIKARTQQYIATLETFYNKDIEASDTYYNKAFKNYNLSDNFYTHSYLFGIQINLASNQYRKKQYSLAIENIEKTIIEFENKIPGFKFQEKETAYRILSLCYEKTNQFELAQESLKISYRINKEVNQQTRNVTFAEITKKYKTDEQKKQILVEQQKNKQRKNLLIGSALFIIFGGIIGTLTLKNSKRKRKLAEQDKELETQKNLTLLKEQEITTINAMVDGQEKERKRIAEDLHDNLGSVLATLKLHFENLKINSQKKKINQETLFDKTEGLIDEAYLKVRSIAHAKNSGVIANQGLLLAVQLMAEKISSADKIKIEVVHFGLDKRLENSLELTIFRIIQELVTNIIKHAEAKNATINIAAYDKNLNIIIEDDGKGFDIKKVNLKNGMGISSIKTRVEHLKGTFEVDATLGKGSSIILDIPIS